MRRSLQRNHSRLGVAKILFLAMFLADRGRAFQLQVLQGERLMRLGERQHLKNGSCCPNGAHCSTARWNPARP